MHADLNEKTHTFIVKIKEKNLKAKYFLEITKYLKQKT